MTRYDAVNYISHGIAKRAGHVGVAAGARQRRGGRREGRQRRRAEEKGRCARGLLRQPQQEGEGRQDRSADRPRERDQPLHPGAVPPPEEQSAVRRRRRRRQDRDRRRPGAPHHPRRGAGRSQERDGVRARHGHAACRHPLSRRFRGAPQAGHQGDRGLSGRDHVHRRDPHRDRRGRHLRRRDGRLEPAQAGARGRHHPLHRLDHLQGIPPVFREGPRAGAPLPEDRRQRAVDPGRDRDHEGPQAVLRVLSQAQVHQRGGEGGGRTVRALHPRPQAARQGDRRDRRVRRGADAAARKQAQEDDRHQGDRDDDRHHGAHPAKDRVEGRRRGAAASRPDAQDHGVRPGQGDRGALDLDQACPRGTARAGEADRLLPVLRSDRRRQDRGGEATRQEPRRGADPLRHVGVHGAPHRLAADRRASGLRRLRPGRPADRRRRPASALRAAARRDREGASRSVQRAAADHGSRQADRPQRQAGRLPQRHPDHDHQRRRGRHGQGGLRLHAQQA